MAPRLSKNKVGALVQEAPTTDFTHCNSAVASVIAQYSASME